jgi:NitT/TauT family transport system ATP-binding protein
MAEAELTNGRAAEAPVVDSKFDAAISVDSVTKTYGVGAKEIAALESTSFDVTSGDFVSIVGPSGCGKTTLLKIIGDVIDPSSGQVSINGRPSRFMRIERKIGFVFQSPVLFPWRTVRDNVVLPFVIARSGGRFRHVSKEHLAQVDQALETVGLADFGDRLPRELSGGMQSRVALARALVSEPTVLLMDEPFAALDELTRTEMALHLLDVWERVRITVVFVTHHIQEAVLLSNRVLVMSQRPGVVRRDIAVDVPRPRSLESRRNSRFEDISEDLTMHFHTHGRD